MDFVCRRGDIGCSGVMRETFSTFDDNSTPLTAGNKIQLLGFLQPRGSLSKEGLQNDPESEEDAATGTVLVHFFDDLW